MDSSNSDDVLQPRTGRQRQHQKVPLVNCPGYIDKNAIWNNGFPCPQWGGPDEKYCCENGSEKFCCPEPEVMTSSTLLLTSTHNPTITTAATDSIDFIPIVLGASGAVLILILAALLACIFIPKCPIYKLRHRKSKNSVVLTRTISVSLEAEATSSVIASQAMSSVTSTSSTQRSNGTNCSYIPVLASPSLHENEDSHLHCGCRWSPRTSGCTAVDLDNLVASLYQSTALPWQTELDNLYNCYTCNGEHGSLCGTVGGNREFGPEGQTLLGIETQLPISTTSPFTLSAPRTRRLDLT